jgi:hypothetical protein
VELVFQSLSLKPNQPDVVGVTSESKWVWPSHYQESGLVSQRTGSVSGLVSAFERLHSPFDFFALSSKCTNSQRDVFKSQISLCSFYLQTLQWFGIALKMTTKILPWL